MVYENCEKFLDDYFNKKIKIKSGSLRFFGDWFGRPMDNYHIVSNVSYEKNILMISFSEGEKVLIYKPQDIEISNNLFVVGKAEEISFENYYSTNNGIKKNFLIKYFRIGDQMFKEEFDDFDRLKSKRKVIVKDFAFEIC